MENIYVSLDEAREEIKRRWNDVELKKKIEAELGDKFMPSFKNEPRAVLFRQVCPMDNGFVFFYQCAKYIDAMPLVLEYHDDIFVHFNEEKKGLGRLRVALEDGEKATIDIMDFHANEKKKLKDCILKTGEKMIDFHRNLFEFYEYKVDFFENSKWFRDIGKAVDYYYYFLLHFIAHGFLFETFSNEEREKDECEFIHNIIAINLEKIKNKFGIKPIIVRSYPKNQTDEEDFYWWNYPPGVNSRIIDYARKNNLTFKYLKL